MNIPFETFIVFAIILFIAIPLRAHRITRRRQAFIEQYSWPPGLTARLAKTHPHLRSLDIDRVGRGLKQFFLAYLLSGGKPVAMPSQVADDLWHEFILSTRAYQAFCEDAFGRFLHHTPAAALDPREKSSNAGLRRVWWHACKLERIDPAKPERLPLLFALDGDYDIAGGFRYHPDCRALMQADRPAGYCGGDFSSVSVDGSTDGFGDGDGGGDGGDGGGGCGGD